MASRNCISRSRAEFCVGRRFNCLTVKAVFKINNKGWTANAKCECKTSVVRPLHSIITGSVKSCGCFRRRKMAAEKFKHGHAIPGSVTRTLSIWYLMRERCKTHHRYAGRGIKICERWQTFSNFLEDMGEPPTNKHTIDRKDNNGNYEKSNCRWATYAEQSRNTSKTVLVEINGVTKCIRDWCDEIGIGESTVKYRRKIMGMSDKDALLMPLGRTSRNRKD